MSLNFPVKGRQGDPGAKGDKGDKGDQGDPGSLNLVDRGDPGSADFTVGDFTCDAAWHDLDLSGIVPAGAMAVLINVVTDTSDANQQILFRKKGKTGWRSAQKVYCLSYYLKDSKDCLVFCDADRKIQYLSNLNWTLLDFTVCGWILE